MRNHLLLATTNPNKIREIKAILEALELEILSPVDLGISLPVVEDGASYSENARLKALAYQATTGQIVLADDSGLEVVALDGAPGIFSARYSNKPDASDADRRAYLLSRLVNTPKPWVAHFHCTAVLAMPDGEVFETDGQCDGEIISEERGSGGFGYDPIFYIPEQQATMAEIPADIKNKISHRAKALLSLFPKLKSL